MSVSGLALGSWLSRRMGRPGVPIVLAFAVGMIVLTFVSLLPYVGPIINIVAVTFGLGTLVLAPRSKPSAMVDPTSGVQAPAVSHRRPPGDLRADRRLKVVRAPSVRAPDCAPAQASTLVDDSSKHRRDGNREQRTCQAKQLTTDQQCDQDDDQRVQLHGVAHHFGCNDVVSYLTPHQ